MNRLGKFATFVIFAIALWTWSQSGPPPATDAQLSVAEIAGNFTNYQRITKSVVSVNPQLTMLCVGITKRTVDAERNKFGPHANIGILNTGILIYMNKLAAGAFGTNATVFPVGSVIVKQKMICGNVDKDEKRVRDADTGVGGMVKRSPGYDPAHGDWEYFYFEDPRKIESGRISSCVQCHESAKSKDHVFGTWSETSH